MVSYCPASGSGDQHSNTTIPDPYTLYSTLSSVEFLFGTPLNTLCLVYFYRQPPSVSRLIHLWINLHDVIKNLLALVPAVSSYLHGAPGILSVPAICTGYGMFWNVAVRQSVFLIALLNATRTFSLLRPFAKIRRGVVLGILVGYLLMQLLQATVPFWFGVSYQYSPMMMGCGWSVLQLFTGPVSKPWFLLAYVLLNVVHYIGPALVVVVCNCVSCSLISRSTSSNTGGDAKREATVTIIALTLAYALLNLPQCGLVLLHLYSIASCNPLPLPFTNVVHILTFTHTANLNSIANALIYVVQVRKLRQFICRLGRRRDGEPGLVRQSTGGALQEYTLLSRLSRDRFSSHQIRTMPDRPTVE